MDIYLAIGFALLALGVSIVCRLRAMRYLFVVAAALALSSCLSLRLGNDNKKQPAGGQTAGVPGAAGSVAETRAPPSPQALGLQCVVHWCRVDGGRWDLLVQHQRGCVDASAVGVAP